jgi:hypothetical protein
VHIKQMNLTFNLALRGKKLKKGKVIPELSQVLHYEDVLAEWRYSSTHSSPRH